MSISKQFFTAAPAKFIACPAPAAGQPYPGTRTTALFIWQKAGYFLKLAVSVPVKACHEPSVLFG
jgi:hypothetical protein